jgi:exosome complex exonuclease RRP6
MGSSQTPLTKSEFDGYHAQLQEYALKATKHAAGLPSDLVFHRSVDPDLAKDLEACSSKVVSITNMLIGLSSTIGSSKSAKGKGKARLQDKDDFMDRFEALIVEPMDQLLERAVRGAFHPCALLSPYTGHRAGRILCRTKAPAIAIRPPEPKKKAAASRRQAPVLHHVSHLPKPQLKFKRRPDNTNGIPWCPSLRHKFNAQVPLGYTFQPANVGEDPDRLLCVFFYHGLGVIPIC